MLVPRSLAVLVLLLVAACGSSTTPLAIEPRAAQGADELKPYHGLGTWVDVYDYVPAFQERSGPAPVTPESLDDMVRLGVKTLYLQVAQDDPRSPGATIDPNLLGRFLTRAHAVGLRVVAWYLPRFNNIDADLRHIRGALGFHAGSERFDALALDLEWTQGVPEPRLRNAAVTDLSRRVRRLAGTRPVGAIVLEPVLLEVINGAYWPDFPWRKLAPFYDVWLPMSYWTNRRQDSGFQDGFKYTDENLRRLRTDLGKPDAPVHPIGGLGNAAKPADYDGFVRAARDQRAIGWSIYDFNVTPSSAWPRLRG